MPGDGDAITSSGRRELIAYRDSVFLGVFLIGFGVALGGEGREGSKMSPMDSSDLRMLFEFDDGAAPWPSIDDVVMGGVSRSEMALADGTAVFRGRLSLENNGGFASIRSRPRTWDLGGFEGLILRLRGDGRVYGFRLRTSRSFDGVSYQARFTAPEGRWQEVVLPFEGFEPVFRGRRVPGYPPLEPAKIQTFGLILADKNPGPFELEIDHISAYRGAAAGVSEASAQAGRAGRDRAQRRTS